MAKSAKRGRPPLKRSNLGKQCAITLNPGQLRDIERCRKEDELDFQSQILRRLMREALAARAAARRSSGV